MINKKGQNLPVNKIIVLVIGLIVLLVFLFFFPGMRTLIFDHIDGLPEYEYDDEPVDLSDIDREALGIGGCNEIVAVIHHEGKDGFMAGIDDFLGRGDTRELFFWDLNEDKLIPTNVLIRAKDEKNMDILVEPGEGLTDVFRGEIGDIKNGIVNLEEDVIGRRGDFSDLDLENIGTWELINFNGAEYFHAGGRHLFCRDEIIESEMSCDEKWEFFNLKNRNYSLIFEGVCGPDYDNRWDFGELDGGECCIEVSNDYKITERDSDKWRWTESQVTGDTKAIFKWCDKDLIDDIKEVSLIYHFGQGRWAVGLEPWEERNKIFYYLGGLSCRNPIGHTTEWNIYDCDNGGGIGIGYEGSVKVKEGHVCEEYAEDIEIKDEYDKIKNLIINNRFSLKRDGEFVIRNLCSYSNHNTRKIGVKFKRSYWWDGEVEFYWDARKNEVRIYGEDAEGGRGDHFINYNGDEFRERLDGDFDKEVFNNVKGKQNNLAIGYILRAESFENFLNNLVDKSITNDYLEVKINEDWRFVEFQDMKKFIEEDEPNYIEDWVNPGYCKMEETAYGWDTNSDGNYEKSIVTKDGEICLEGEEEICGKTCFCKENFKDGDKLTISMPQRRRTEVYNINRVDIEDKIYLRLREHDVIQRGSE